MLRRVAGGSKRSKRYYSYRLGEGAFRVKPSSFQSWSLFSCSSSPFFCSSPPLLLNCLLPSLSERNNPDCRRSPPSCQQPGHKGKYIRTSVACEHNPPTPRRGLLCFGMQHSFWKDSSIKVLITFRSFGSVYVRGGEGGHETLVLGATRSPSSLLCVCLGCVTCSFGPLSLKSNSVYY